LQGSAMGSTATTRGGQLLAQSGHSTAVADSYGKLIKSQSFTNRTWN
jgi:hypothetical protein